MPHAASPSSLRSARGCSYLRPKPAHPLCSPAHRATLRAVRRTERLCARSSPNRGLVGFGLDVSSVDVLWFLKEGPPERRWCAGRRGVYYSGCCTTPGTPPNAVHREVRVECGAQLAREGRTKLGFGVWRSVGVYPIRGVGFSGGCEPLA